MHELDFQSAIETNIIKLGPMTMEAFDNRILVVEDEFRSGYECPDCVNKKKIKSPELEELVCEGCGGNGKSRIVDGAKCTTCQGSGRTLCPTCLGKGGVIVVAEQSERRPTTGTVVSLGDAIFCKLCGGLGFKEGVGADDAPYFRDCTRCKGTGGTKTIQRGESVIYTSFSGHVYDLELADGEQIVIRVIQECDILGKVSGHLELKRTKQSRNFASAA